MKGFEPGVKPTFIKVSTGTACTNVEGRVTTYGCVHSSTWIPSGPPSGPVARKCFLHIGECLTTACNATQFILIGCKCKWESLFWKNHYTTKYSEWCMSLYGCWLSQFSVLQTPFIWISDYLLYMKAIYWVTMGPRLLRSSAKPSV